MDFELQQIQSAFNRCFGLKDALKSTDKLLLKEAIQSLSYQSAIRVKFIENNLDKILEL